jgi:hypothetical protein
MSETDLSKRPELKAFFARGYWQCNCGGYKLRKPDLAECPECHSARPTLPDAAPPSHTNTQPAKPQPAAKHKASGGPTKTELEARRMHCPQDARFEAITIRMSNGHRYTPDWVWWQDGRLHCLEAKGSYKLGSYQRARLAFDQAKVEFPDVRWIWAERRNDGTWKVS